MTIETSAIFPSFSEYVDLSQVDRCGSITSYIGNEVPKVSQTAKQNRKPISRATASYQGPELTARTIPEFARMFHIGLNQAYGLARRGVVRTIDLGGQKRVTDEEIARLKRCPSRLDRRESEDADDINPDEPKAADDNRFYHVAKKFYELGPRPMAELLLEIGAWTTRRTAIERRMTDYLERLDPAVLRALSADWVATPGIHMAQK